MSLILEGILLCVVASLVSLSNAVPIAPPVGKYAVAPVTGLAALNATSSKGLPVMLISEQGMSLGAKRPFYVNSFFKAL